MSRSRPPSKLVLAPAAASALPTASLGHGAPLVGLLLGGQGRLALLPVLLQQLGGLLLLQLCVDDLDEALPLLGKSIEACRKRTRESECDAEQQRRGQHVDLQLPGVCFTFHFEDGVLGHLFAISLHLLLDPLLVVLLRRTDHHSFALEAGEQAHLPLLARGRHISLPHKHTSQHCNLFYSFLKKRQSTYMVQNVVPLLSGSDFNKFSQEKRRSLGDGGELRDVFGLALQAVDLQR